MKTPHLFVSAESLVERLFQFTEGRQAENKKFIQEMITGILLGRSPLLANIARVLGEAKRLIYTEQRLSKFLNSDKLPWDEIKSRAVEINCMRIRDNDVIAFDPGDLVKEYAEKMENLQLIHDGSKHSRAPGYEEFSAEAVQWINGKRHHVPLYHKLTNASCQDYMSQNYQIVEAIRAIYEHTKSKGIWTFDRGHDRNLIFVKSLLIFEGMRWIVRMKNRLVIPEDSAYLKENKKSVNLFELVQKLPLGERPIRLDFPQATSDLYVGWTRVKLPEDPKENRWLTIVVVHDRRNIEPVILLTNEPVSHLHDAIIVFGHYIERWRKEEGYRFCKVFLNTESIRVMSYQSIQNLAWLAHMAYCLVALFYRSAPQQVEELIESELRHFVPIQKVSYRYYRVAELMRLLLWRQLGQPETPLMLTEVG